MRSTSSTGIQSNKFRFLERLYDNLPTLVTSIKLIREAAKKVLLLMAGPLRPPPPASSLERWNVEKKGAKISYVFLHGPVLYPPPLPLNGPAIKRRTFFSASLSQVSNIIDEVFRSFLIPFHKVFFSNVMSFSFR